MADTNRFTFSFYVQTLTKVLGAPMQFFSELPDRVPFQKSFGFLLVSGLFFAGASLTHIQEQRFLVAGIFLANALAMPVIATAVSFMIMTMTIGKRVGFEKFFAVYAFASGVTLLAAWIPLFVWLTEPWKWLLVGIGMVKGCGFKWVQAVVVVGLSVLILMLFFWSLGPVILRIRGVSG